MAFLVVLIVASCRSGSLRKIGEAQRPCTATSRLSSLPPHARADLCVWDALPPSSHSSASICTSGVPGDGPLRCYDQCRPTPYADTLCGARRAAERCLVSDVLPCLPGHGEGQPSRWTDSGAAVGSLCSPLCHVCQCVRCAHRVYAPRQQVRVFIELENV